VIEPTDRLTEAVPPGHSLLVDTSVVLSYLAGSERVSPLAAELFDACTSTGRNPTALSAVTVAEILVRPFRTSPAVVATAEGFLRHFGDLRLVDVTYAVAREAARIRALTDLAMPDAFIAASASIAEIDILVTNDRRWPARLEPALPGLRIVVLADLGTAN
jgi:predicted nucleic acid-binding protein